MTISTLEELFVHGIADVRDAEEQITKALPKLIEKAQNKDLKADLEAHLEETKEQIARLDEIIESLDEKPKSVTCKGMEGILKEGDEKLKSVDDSLIDIAIAGGAGHVEHYEMSAYMSLIELAAALEMDDAVDLLKKSLGEEEGAAKKVEKAFKKGAAEVEEE